MQYTKYRWFFTTTGKLVIGGKNAEQNEQLVKEMLGDGNDYLVMHTHSPGSPFSFLISKISELADSDVKEAAIFTACFSHEWKKGSKKAKIDIFSTKQISKTKDMKTGTFGVKGKVKSKEVPLKLYLSTQEDKLRAVPFDKNSSISLIPGKVEKEKIAQILSTRGFKKEELLQALPSGGIKIIEKLSNS